MCPELQRGEHLWWARTATLNTVVVVAFVVVVVVVVVVLTLTHRYDTMQSVVAGQAPVNLEWKKSLGKK